MPSRKRKPASQPARRIVVGISGASGAILGVRLLQVLRDLGIETHLVMSKAAEQTLAYETDWTGARVRKLATRAYHVNDVAAPISSGSFRSLGMIVMPCSVKTMSEIATGVTGNLLARAADVCLKERRPLVLAVRETPLHAIHLRNMTILAEMGVIIAPPMPGFYSRPKTVADLVDHTVGRALDLFGLDAGLVKRWRETETAAFAAVRRADKD
ncbi:MAG: UbiX family flavin prenyltransferase [Rhodospirillales bacterium]|nr:UbiX family flavin prenyltransferase [Rhodospirillales bacterium]